MELGVDHSQKINGNYEMHEKIGADTCSEVYRVTDPSGTDFAAKFVSKHYHFILENESRAIHWAGRSREHGMPSWHYYGRHGKHYVLVMDLFGQSLTSILNKYGHLSLKSATLLGIQMTSRIEKLHHRGFIHCDIKPDNFLVGMKGDDQNCLHLINYGFSLRYNVGKPRRYGLASRKSDLLHAIGVVVYLLKGLSWNHVRFGYLSSAGCINDSKTAVELWGGLPVGIARYYSYVMGLRRTKTPNYVVLRSYLQEVLSSYCVATDDEFEWTRS